jgi:hypothetical protein
MAMNFAPLDCPCQGASSESKKIYLDFFHFRENRKKPKNPYFWLPQQFGSNRRQKIFRKKPPFYIIFTSENHLNAHSSLIKQHMAMNRPQKMFSKKP